MQPDSLGFDILSLRAAYAAGLTPRALLAEVLRRIGTDPQRAWLEVLTPEQLEHQLQRLERLRPDQLPLYGLPFAIKDNIDLAGVRTTAGCEAFAYLPGRSAFVVERLIAAGALPIGKTSLDQFATGLNGTRSPYGACRNAFDGAYISGGSSSGSAVAVALGQVSFALGTDTAGSGRVPAAFNNVVGLKPTRGLLSTRGVVPCCASLDCVSLFALTVADAQRVFDIASGFDAESCWSRDATQREFGTRAGELQVGIPGRELLDFFGDAQAQAAHAAALERFATLGVRIVEIDLAHFREAAELLYGGAWVTERYAGLRGFYDAHPDALLPVTRSIIIDGARRFSAADAFDAMHRLQELRRRTAQTFTQVDCLLLPTTPRIYTIDQLQADPVTLNNHLGYWTNFMNLLDLCGVAVPAGFARGLPYGITLCAPALLDRALLRLAARWHALTALPLGATGRAQPVEPRGAAASDASESVLLAVCGAHMQGLPLNAQLIDRGATFVRRTMTSPHYRLHALPGGPPQRPGLVRSAAGGSAIEVEVWAMPTREFGSLLAAVPAPLGFAQVTLQDGSSVTGFVCEAAAVTNAPDISAHGGWRAWLAATNPEQQS